MAALEHRAQDRRKDISAVLAAVPKAATEHPCCKKQPHYKAEAAFRFLFGQKDDRNCELILTVLVFDVPSVAAKELTSPEPASPVPPPKRRILRKR